jgi:peptide/nickel transport system substrate-binding protein
MGIDHDRVDSLRKGRSELENHVIDEFLAGRVSRREFLRRGSVLGMSVPLIGAIVGIRGRLDGIRTERPRSTAGASSARLGKAGSKINVGSIVPTASLNPVTIEDEGGLEMLGQTGEYLYLADQQAGLQPVLSTGHTTNADSTVWTVNIRKGVKFHDGTPLTADDVVYTYKLQADPKGDGNALSVFGGLLVPDGVVKVDDYTVAFHLEAPDGNFPYALSSENYNCIIIPNNYDPADWQSSFIGTGPFVKTAYTEKVGASFARNESYWGRKALPSSTHWTFYDSETPMSLALQAGTIDCLDQFSVSVSPELLNGDYNVIALKASTHRELSMRCDLKPFDDPRVRQAIALTINRPELVKALFKGYAQVGNDNPFAPLFLSTNTSVPQRVQNIKKAKALLSAAGYPHGFTTHLYTESLQEMPDYAQSVKQFAAEIGVTINLTVDDSDIYYSKYWLTGIMSLVDFGARSVPNLFLQAPLQSTGTWNAAHFKNKTYDKLSNEYIAASDLSKQRSIAGKIETLLLEETPVIYSYFYDFLSATSKQVSGVYPTAIGHLFLWDAAKS